MGLGPTRSCAGGRRAICRKKLLVIRIPVCYRHRILPVSTNTLGAPKPTVSEVDGPAILAPSRGTREIRGHSPRKIVPENKGMGRSWRNPPSSRVGPRPRQKGVRALSHIEKKKNWGGGKKVEKGEKKLGGNPF